jgi:hypothetical protein
MTGERRNSIEANFWDEGLFNLHCGGYSSQAPLELHFRPRRILLSKRVSVVLQKPACVVDRAGFDVAQSRL